MNQVFPLFPRMIPQFTMCPAKTRLLSNEQMFRSLWFFLLCDGSYSFEPLLSSNLSHCPIECFFRSSAKTENKLIPAGLKCKMSQFIIFLGMLSMRVKPVTYYDSRWRDMCVEYRTCRVMWDGTIGDHRELFAKLVSEYISSFPKGSSLREIDSFEIIKECQSETISETECSANVSCGIPVSFMWPFEYMIALFLANELMSANIHRHECHDINRYVNVVRMWSMLKNGSNTVVNKFVHWPIICLLDNLPTPSFGSDVTIVVADSCYNLLIENLKLVVHRSNFITDERYLYRFDDISIIRVSSRWILSCASVSINTLKR